MRTLVDLAERQVRALDELSRRQKRARAALIREAIDHYIALRGEDRLTDAFGLWGERKIDGLTYQNEVRAEW